MALKKPSDLFGNKADENNTPIIESDSSFREELIKVESLSEQVLQLQQELTQKVIKNDLESLVLSQINNMQENFEYLQNDFKKSNKKDIVEFKEKVTELTEIVGNLVENELPKYKKQVTKNEVNNALTTNNRCDLFIVFNIEHKYSGKTVKGVNGETHLIKRWNPRKDDLTALEYLYKVNI